MIEFSTSTIVIALIGSFLAGIINTFAGNGSAITLTILTELMGLPPNVANGTNRIGILSQGLPSSYIFHRKGYISFRDDWPIMISILIGAIIGVAVAVVIDNESFRQVFRYLLVILFLLVLVKPKRWLNPTVAINIPMPVLIIIYLVLGFYGGFIQMGMGILMLSVFVLLRGKNLISANALKLISVTLYTIVVLAIFAYNGLVDWRVGLIFAIGQATGGTLASYFATTFPKADIWAYRLLILILIWSILSVFDVI